ncbi:MAG: hypothetical protein HY689_06780 [Chloroflexi bacterium]|nr:hypothetical protein [Chloroflexota bacterium]
MLWFPWFLILATVVSRWPFRTHYLFMWDSANFALALGHYDVTQHRPHPPGYFLFVAVGRVLMPLTGDANTALVVEALAFSALAAVVLYALGRTMYGETVGRWAALLLLGSVTFWSFGGMALAYPSLAFFSALVALLAYRVLFLKEERLVPLAGAYALGGGFRPDLMLFLGPLFGACLWGQSWRRRAVAVGVAALGCAAWFVPTVVFSGGLESYLAVLSAYGGTDVLDRYSVLRRGMPALVNNTGDTIAYLFYALYGTALLIPGAVLGWLVAWRTAGQRLASSLEGRKALFLLAWMAPMVLFYVVIHIGYAGYVFSFLPAVLLALARGWSLAPLPVRAPEARRAALWGTVGVVLAINTAVFLFHPRLLTAPGLRASDAAIAARLALIQSTDPERTVLVSYDSLKHLDYYVPQYRQSIWVDIFAPGERGYPLPPGAQEILLVDASLVAMAEGLPGTVIPLAGGERAQRVPLPQTAGPRFLVYRPGALSLSIP